MSQVTILAYATGQKVDEVTIPAGVRGPNKRRAAAIMARQKHLEINRLKGGDLSGADLRGAVLESWFWDNCFDDARLNGATLSCTRFYRCSLEDAHFKDATLKKVQFINCNLDGASFKDTPLHGVRFFGCDLAGVKEVVNLGCPDRHDAFAFMGMWPISQATGRPLKRSKPTLLIRGGCRLMPVEDGFEYWSPIKVRERYGALAGYSRAEAIAACHYAKAVAVARGWIPPDD